MSVALILVARAWDRQRTEPGLPARDRPSPPSARRGRTLPLRGLSRVALEDRDSLNNCQNCQVARYRAARFTGKMFMLYPGDGSEAGRRATR